MKTITGVTSDNQWLDFHGTGDNNDHLGNVRYVQIETTQSASWVSWKEVEIDRGTEYFGYWMSAGADGDYTAATRAAGANLTWIASQTSDLGIDIYTMKQKLAVARNNGSKAVIDLGYQLFTRSTTSPYNLVRRSSWSDNIHEVVASLMGEYSDVIAAFTPQDEPYDLASTDTTMRTWLTDISSQIRLYAPGVPIAVLLQHPVVERGNSTYVEMFDWVGFDCYPNIWTEEVCGANNNHSLTSLEMTLGTWLTGNQRRLAVPRSFLGDGYTMLDKQLEVIDATNKWHEIVLADARYIAVVPFLWQSADLSIPPNGLPEQGANALTWVRKRYTQLADATIGPAGVQLWPIQSSASATSGTQAPFAAANGDTEDGWGAGAFPAQWINFDLGGSARVGSINLVVGQYPAGPYATTHSVYVSSAPNCNEPGTFPSGWTILTTFSQNTVDGQTLTWTGSADARCLRVRTTSSSSWVSWREVRINGVP